MKPTTFPIILEDAFMISPKVKHFIFKSMQTPPFDYIPGQFITIHFTHQDKLLRRSYSIANVPTQNNRIEFAAGYVENGPGTELLFQLKPGDSINIIGPYGRLLLKPETPKRYILIATSTGITPYRAMMAELKQKLQADPEFKLVILQGVQKREDILYKEDFLTLLNDCPRVDFRTYLSREESVDVQSHEYKGYVQHAFPDLTLNPQEDIVYLCGNPSMIDDAFAYLKDAGFTMQQVIREKYISN